MFGFSKGYCETVIKITRMKKKQRKMEKTRAEMEAVKEQEERVRKLWEM